MSAQIPETMLMSDLLKSTGYDCPEELQDRTFAEATAGGDVQTNKASTIDVSAYTEPVVIKPDTDYESMKKNTVTLSNIPVAKTEVALEATENKTYTPEEGKVYNSVTVNVPQGATKLYAWSSGTGSGKRAAYTNTATPTTSDKLYLTLNNGSSGPATQVYPTIQEIAAVGDNTITWGSETFTRWAAGDIDLTVF